MTKHFSDDDFSLEELYAAARIDFKIFMELAFSELHPGQSLDHAPYLDLTAHILDLVKLGGIDRLVVNMPPGFLKSMIFSIMYPAWRLGVDPTYKFICISYGDDLSNKHSASTRKLMQSDVYKAIFPNTILDKATESHLRTTKDGYRYATACLSDITGFRANEIIVDDPMEPKDATSELVKNKLRDWIFGSVLTRFIDSKKNAFILVMHRLAPDDIASTLSRKEEYFTLSLPLVAEEDVTFEEEDENGKTKILMKRKVGDYLNPSRMDDTLLKKLKADISPHAYASQYQQRPVHGASGMCNVAKLHRYEKLPKLELIIHSWDIGATITGNASVCTKWGLVKLGGRDTLFLLDVVNIKVELPDVRAAIKKEDAQDEPELILIDDRGCGLGVRQDFRKKGWLHVIGVSEHTKSNDSKIEHFGRALLPMYDGLVLFPTTAPYLDGLLNALTAFPEAKEKDLIDSMTQLLGRIPGALVRARQRRRPGSGY